MPMRHSESLNISMLYGGQLMVSLVMVHNGYTSRIPKANAHEHKNGNIPEKNKQQPWSWWFTIVLKMVDAAVYKPIGIDGKPKIRRWENCMVAFYYGTPINHAPLRYDK